MVRCVLPVCLPASSKLREKCFFTEAPIMLLKKFTFFSIFNSIFFILLADNFINQIIRGYRKESWMIAEWLINYEGGFVRRGLPGEMIFDLYNYFGISPYNFILIFTICAFMALSFFFVKSFFQNGWPLFILLYPFFLGGSITNNFWVRKDILIILIFISIVYTAKNNFRIALNSKASPWKFIIAINVILSFGILVHEELGFLAFPIILFLLSSNDKNKLPVFKSALFSILKLSPSLIIFFLCLYFHGSPTTSTLIWNSWNLIPFPNQATIIIPPPTAVEAISRSVSQGLSFSLDTSRNFSDGIYAP